MNVKNNVSFNHDDNFMSFIQKPSSNPNQTNAAIASIFSKISEDKPANVNKEINENHTIKYLSISKDGALHHIKKEEITSEEDLVKLLTKSKIVPAKIDEHGNYILSTHSDSVIGKLKKDKLTIQKMSKRGYIKTKTLDSSRFTVAKISEEQYHRQILSFAQSIAKHLRLLKQLEQKEKKGRHLSEHKFLRNSRLDNVLSVVDKIDKTAAPLKKKRSSKAIEIEILENAYKDERIHDERKKERAKKKLLEMKRLEHKEEDKELKKYEQKQQKLKSTFTE